MKLHEIAKNYLIFVYYPVCIYMDVMMSHTEAFVCVHACECVRYHVPIQFGGESLKLVPHLMLTSSTNTLIRTHTKETSA